MSIQGDIVTVILWHGQYHNDGREVLGRLLEEGTAHVPLMGGDNVRLEGDAGRWFVVADAVRYQP